jgi:dihydrodipicolinate synthase/N-acetylneuraminate lyase
VQFLELHMSSFELIAAPHTPFATNGDLALDIVAQQAAHLRADGVQGVLIAGSTGEGSRWLAGLDPHRPQQPA